MNDRLSLIIPINKGYNVSYPLEEGLGENHDTLRLRVRQWFPDLCGIILKYREGKRSYNRLPGFYYLLYEKERYVNGTISWQRIFEIKAFDINRMDIHDFRTGQVHRYPTP